VVQDRHHQASVVLHHRALSGIERMRLGPALSDADRQRAFLGGVVGCSRVAGHVETWDTDRSTGSRELHQRVEDRRRVLLLGGVAVAAGLEADRVDTAVYLAYAEDLLDLLLGVTLGDADGLAAEAACLGEPFL